MDVFLANEQSLGFDEVTLSALARHTLTQEEVDEGAELSLLFVEADHIRKLNQRFAGDDYATDVLAFPMMEDEEDGSLLLGDVVICPQVAEKNAGELGHDLQDELAALVVHGTLHLLGYDHQRDADKEKMDNRSREILSTFSAPR
ncbi:MAG: putative rRNA maturation factor [Actinomycetota bacterium]|jgi:probable rRNA maturation factor|nr:putative rRNA maturation factor [Actinomycetota bacterium]